MNEFRVRRCPSVLCNFNCCFLSAIYTDTLDSAGHMFGPNDNRIDSFLQDVDDAMVFFIDELERRNLQNDVDVMFLSDHGMAELSDSRVINITRSITDDCERVIYEWPHAQIWPKPGMSESVSHESWCG